MRDYDQKNVSLFETNKELSQWKKDHPELKTVHSQVLQKFKAFFRRAKLGENPGYPGFKGKGRYDSVTYPQAGWEIKERSVKFSKIGEIQTIFPRVMDGNVKTVTIRKTPTQQWFVSIVCEDVPTHHLPPSPECVGIDGGLKTFAMLSNGRSIDNPKFYQTEQVNLATVQHRLSL